MCRKQDANGVKPEKPEDEHLFFKDSLGALKTPYHSLTLFQRKQKNLWVVTSDPEVMVPKEFLELSERLARNLLV